MFICSGKKIANHYEEEYNLLDGSICAVHMAYNPNLNVFSSYIYSTILI